ncbi:TPA: DUF4393 domain-containing protein [Vibrio cholerae]
MDLMKSVFGSVDLLKEIYGDLAKPSVVKVGEALETVFGLGNTALLPLTLLNEVSRMRFQKNLERYRVKMENCPSDDVQPVPPEVGVPIVEKLMYVSDDTLVDMYAKLLASASNKKLCNVAHPSFVNIINNLSPEEAKLLIDLSNDNILPFVEVKRNVEQKGFTVIDDLYTKYSYNDILENKSNSSAYFSNLEGLGIIKIRKDVYISNKLLYSDLESKYMSQFSVMALVRSKVESLTSEQKDEILPKLTEAEKMISEIGFNHGKIEITPFGLLFLKACTSK